MEFFKRRVPKITVPGRKATRGEVFYHFGKDNNNMWFHQKKKHTPGKTNMEPENPTLEKEKHLPNHHFQVPC